VGKVPIYALPKYKIDVLFVATFSVLKLTSFLFNVSSWKPEAKLPPGECVNTRRLNLFYADYSVLKFPHTP
jgi:hypothetical protein